MSHLAHARRTRGPASTPPTDMETCIKLPVMVTPSEHLRRRLRPATPHQAQATQATSDQSRLPSKACSINSSSSPRPKAAETSSNVAPVLKASDQSGLPSKACNVNSSSSPRPKAAETPSDAAAVLKRTNRPGLSTGRKNGRQSSQKRDCLFPGCKAQPTHGLPGAVRAVYCFSHKKGPMVDLFNESPGVLKSAKTAGSAAAGVTPRKKTTGTTPSKGSTAAAGGTQGETRAASGVDKTAAKKAWHGSKAKKDRNFIDGGQNNKSKNRRESNGGKDNRGEASKPNVTGDYLPKTAPVETTAPPLPSPTSAPAANSLPSPTNRSGDTSGMAPSVEFLLLRQAREAAKREAAASGGGRRPRAPSRRALEASGQLKNDGAQWMTRERKEEQARFNAELRKQRRQYKAAGLKSGVVLEAFVAEAAETGTVDGGVGGDIAGEFGTGSAKTKHGRDPAWQKVSPAMISASPEQEQATDQGGLLSATAGERPSKRPRPSSAADSAPSSESFDMVEDLSGGLDGSSVDSMA
ncbi:unnamed protein product [Ectocarpus fasciculatus]